MASGQVPWGVALTRLTIPSPVDRQRFHFFLSLAYFLDPGPWMSTSLRMLVPRKVRTGPSSPGWESPRTVRSPSTRDIESSMRTPSGTRKVASHITIVRSMVM